MKSRYEYKRQVALVVTGGCRIREYMVHLRGFGTANFTIPINATRERFVAPLYTSCRQLIKGYNDTDCEVEVDVPLGYLLHFNNNSVWISLRKVSVFG